MISTTSQGQDWRDPDATGGAETISNISVLRGSDAGCAAKSWFLAVGVSVSIATVFQR